MLFRARFSTASEKHSVSCEGGKIEGQACAARPLSDPTACDRPGLKKTLQDRYVMDEPLEASWGVGTDIMRLEVHAFWTRLSEKWCSSGAKAEVLFVCLRQPLTNSTL